MRCKRSTPLRNPRKTGTMLGVPRKESSGFFSGLGARIHALCLIETGSLMSLFLYRVLTQVWCKLMEDFEKGAERGDLNALCVGRIDLGTCLVAGCTNSRGREQVNLH
jgi:hypothetical protein